MPASNQPFEYCLSMMELGHVAHPKMFSGWVIQAQCSRFNHCACENWASH
jgi:hypothetical protein